MLPQEFKAFEYPSVYHDDRFKWDRFCMIWNQLFGWVHHATKGFLQKDKNWSPYA